MAKLKNVASLSCVCGLENSALFPPSFLFQLWTCSRCAREGSMRPRDQSAEFGRVCAGEEGRSSFAIVFVLSRRLFSVLAVAHHASCVTGVPRAASTMTASRMLSWVIGQHIGFFQKNLVASVATDRPSTISAMHVRTRYQSISRHYSCLHHVVPVVCKEWSAHVKSNNENLRWYLCNVGH